MSKRRSFIKSAMGLGAGASMGAMASVPTGERIAAKGGIRWGNLYFSSGITGVRPEAHKDPDRVRRRHQHGSRRHCGRAAND
jgi:hypothetical protein